MITILLVLQIIIALCLIGSILIQRSEGGLGLGGDGAMGGFMNVRGTANFLTRVTSVLAALFIGCSLLLAILAGKQRSSTSIIDSIPGQAAPAQTAPADKDKVSEKSDTKSEPAQTAEVPAAPSAPASEAPATAPVEPTPPTAEAPAAEPAAPAAQ